MKQLSVQAEFLFLLHWLAAVDRLMLPPSCGCLEVLPDHNVLKPHMHHACLLLPRSVLVGGNCGASACKEHLQAVGLAARKEIENVKSVRGAGGKLTHIQRSSVGERLGKLEGTGVWALSNQRGEHVCHKNSREGGLKTEVGTKV